MVKLYFGKNKNELLKNIFGVAFDSIQIKNNGKPYIPGGPEFNLSHSGGITVCAVGEIEVGIDIEQIKPRNMDRIIRLFSFAERKRISALDGCEKLHEFYRCWTAKEAKAKHGGGGINRVLIENTDYMSENFFIGGKYGEEYIFTLYTEKKAEITELYGDAEINFF